jgi:hypothetical protein
MAVIPKCPECGGGCQRMELDTRPAVYECDDCRQLFTRSGGRVQGMSLRQIRRLLIQRWDQLADDVHRLIQDMRSAPAGTFTDEERAEAVFELDNTVWDVMVNSRPRLPSSRHKPAGWESLREARRRRLVLEMLHQEEAKALEEATL